MFLDSLRGCGGEKSGAGISVRWNISTPIVMGFVVDVIRAVLELGGSLVLPT